MPLMESNEQQLQKAKVSAVEKKLLLGKISQMNNLPTPSGNIMKVMLMLRDEDVKINQLVPAIEKDQSLVAQILKLVNSGFYGLKKTVESVEHAVTLLGILNIKHVVYSASIMEFFSDEEQLEWNHSYSTSVLMGNLIKENELPGINSLPLSMLMHDLGKVVLRRFSPKKYLVCLQHAANDRVPVFRIEEAMLQINHAEVGGMLLKKWDTAEEIVKPVLQHHSSAVPEEYIFETALMQFVNWVDCEVRGINCYPPSREIMEAGGIEEIEKEYWLNYQTKLIASIEGGRPMDPQLKTSGRIQRKPSSSAPAPSSSGGDTDTRELEKRAMKGAPQHKDSKQPPAPAAHHTEPVISRPDSRPQPPPPSEKAATEPKLSVCVQSQALSPKEIDIISKQTAKQAAPQPVRSGAQKPQEEQEPEGAVPPELAEVKKSNRPTQVIQRRSMVPAASPAQEAQPQESPAPAAPPPQRKPGAPVPFQAPQEEPPQAPPELVVHEEPAAMEAVQEPVHEEPAPVAPVQAPEPAPAPKPLLKPQPQELQGPTTLTGTRICRQEGKKAGGFMGWLKSLFGR